MAVRAKNKTNAVSAAKQRAAIYIRVSTDAQREEGYSIDAQKEMLTAYCVSRQISDYDYYIDGGFTGSNMERPELQRLIHDAKNHRINCVVVYKLDRLSRSQKDTLYLIEDVFNPHGVDFVSLKETMDTSTPMGRLMIGILSAFAQLERENIRERTQMGMRERVKSGLWPGGGRIPFGYDYDANKGILVPNQDAETVRKVYELYLQGFSLMKISQLVGLNYEKLAYQILNRKSNAGFITYGGEEYVGQHEPIISLDTYDKAMGMQRDRAQKGHYTASNYLLTGLMVCGRCGAKLRYQKWGSAGIKIVCYSQDKHKPHLIKDPNCDLPKVWAEEIEREVLETLFEFKFERLLPEFDEPQEFNVLEMLHSQYEQQAAKIKRLYNLYGDGGNELLLATIEASQKDLASIQEQIAREQTRGALQSRIATIKDDIKDLRSAWPVMTPGEQQHVVREVLKSVTFDGEHIELEYGF